MKLPSFSFTILLGIEFTFLLFRFDLRAVTETGKIRRDKKRDMVMIKVEIDLFPIIIYGLSKNLMKERPGERRKRSACVCVVEKRASGFKILLLGG